MKLRKMVAAVLSTALVVTGMPNMATSVFNVAKAAEVKKNQADLYFNSDADLVLNSAAEFFKFARNVQNGETYEGKKVVLATDIDMSIYDSFYGVGGSSSKTAFRGIFDGAGHTIYGANVVSSGGEYSGIFNYVYEGTIKNLNVINAKIQGNTDSNAEGAGGIVGGTNETVVSNCTFQGSVNGYWAVGGIVGFLDYESLVVNCGVSKSRISGKNKIGGVVGDLGSGNAVENSFFTGTVAGTGIDIGGLVGETSGHIVNSYVMPTIEITNDVQATDVGLVTGDVGERASAAACYYLENDKWNAVGTNASSNFKPSACTDEELTSQTFLQKLNANKVSFSADTWTGWVEGENGYPRLGKINRVCYTKVPGVILLNNETYGEEGQTYSAVLKMGSGISQIIPSVYTISDKRKIDSTYKNSKLEFTMPGEPVYMDFETVAATATPIPTETPTTPPTAEPTQTPIATSTTTPQEPTGKIPVICGTKEGVLIENYQEYGETGKLYSVVLKKEAGISEIIPTVHLADGTVIETNYLNGVLSFIMPKDTVYIDFETIAAPATEVPATTATVMPTEVPTTEPTQTPATEPSATPSVKPDPTTIPDGVPTVTPHSTTKPDSTSAASPSPNPGTGGVPSPSNKPSASPTLTPAKTPTVEATQTPRPGIEAIPKKVTLYVDGNAGKSVKLRTNIKNGSQFKLSYSSGNKKVATVSKSGVVTAKAKGSTVIFAKLISTQEPNISYNFVITTVTVKKAGITFKKPVSTLKVKQKKKLTVVLNGLQGKVTWKVSDKKIATISKNGTITAKKAGKVKVTAICGKYKKTCSIVVKK